MAHPFRQNIAGVQNLKPSPVSIFFQDETIASGDVVSRGSPADKIVHFRLLSIKPGNVVTNTNEDSL